MNKKVLLWVPIGALAIVAALALAMPTSAVKKDIGSDELVQLQRAGAILIDVRTPGEYAVGHIAAATNVPLDQLTQAAGTWNKDTAVVVYCATGARSAEAADTLAGQGFRKVYNLGKGVVAWTGKLVGGEETASAPVGAGAVKTNGKPLFIAFSSST